MIYFLSLLCSLSIQFCSVGITPYNMLPNNQSGVGQQYIDIVKERIRNNYNGFWAEYYSWALSVPEEDWIVIKGASVWGSYSSEYTILLPREYYDNTASSSIICSSYSSSDDTVDSVTLQFNDYCQFFTTSSYLNDPFNNSATSYGFTNSSNYELVYCYKPIYYNNELVVTVTDDVTVPEFPSFGGLGSLESGGHSSGSSPFDSLNNNTISWGSMTGHSTGGSTGPSPHSSSTHFSSITPSPDSNDSKTDSLLFMIGNKLADITENTGAIGDALGGIMYNQVAGASALFNAISGFNQNFIDAFTPPSKEDFSATLQTSEIYSSYQNVSSSVTAMTTTLNSVGQQSGYVWKISLPESWGGDLSFNFSNYLDTETLNFIRILIGAILIISTVVFVAHQFPDIIGGGSGGENV